MSDEPSFKTKADVLDLLINFLREHEKQMDNMLQRLEMLVEILSTKRRSIERIEASPPSEEAQASPFTLTITNPEHFDEIRSLNIMWGRDRGAVTDINRMKN